ncbi:MAG: glycosyltransferase family 4 protein [Alphaproteobacteria bacterium]|nr:glycosyltransferase family 4 protein [Alphaproteobacteria bacterium]
MQIAANINTGTDETELSGLGVLQVLPRLNMGGAERSAVDIALAVARAGGRSFVASAGGDMTRELERAGVRHLALPLASKNPFRIRANGGRLADLVRQQGIDIVHARSRAPAWSARHAARSAGAHFITTVHGVYGEGSAFKRRYNRVMAEGERVIANSEFVARHLRAAYGLEDGRLVTIPRGIDEQYFDPARVRGDRMADLARRWRLPDGAMIVLMPGRVSRRKGQRHLIEALARLDRPDLLAVILGSSGEHRSYARELLELVRARGMEGRVRLVEDCPDMPAAYMLADVVVSAADKPEAFGRVLVEAQAMGRPVIATDHGGARETVLAGQTGWLLPPGDVAALAATIAEALALDTETRLAVAEAARHHVLEHYTLARMNGATLRLYRSLAGR